MMTFFASVSNQCEPPTPPPFPNIFWDSRHCFTDGNLAGKRRGDVGENTHARRGK